MPGRRGRVTETVTNCACEHMFPSLCMLACVAYGSIPIQNHSLLHSSPSSPVISPVWNHQLMTIFYYLLHVISNRFIQMQIKWRWLWWIPNYSLVNLQWLVEILLFAQIPLEGGYARSTISFDFLTALRFRSSFGLVPWVDSLFNDHAEVILVTEKDFEVNLLLVRYKSNISLINRFQELQVLKSIFRFLLD